MTVAAALAAIQAASQAFTSIVGLLHDHEQKLAQLEAKVLAHDAALEHATLNTPKET